MRVRRLTSGLISLAACGILAVLCPLLSAHTPEYQVKQGPTLPLGAISFEPKSAVHGLTADDFRFSSEVWESSDGVGIVLRRLYCGSAKNAERALRREAKSVNKIIESKILRATNGTKVGRRMIVLFGSDETQRRQTILWTDHDMFYSVESASFQHALLFEKRFPDL